MRLFTIIIASIFAIIPVDGNDAKSALEDFEALKRLAKTISAESTEDEVILLLGEPKVKGRGGWNNLDKKVWTYLSHTDDSQHLCVKVYFSPKSGCSIGTSHRLRKDVKKGKLRFTTGTVVQINHNYPTKGGDGFLCDVKFDSGITLPVAVGLRDRVIGEPIIGSKIKIAHYGSEWHHIYLGYYSFFLESITFAKE